MKPGTQICLGFDGSETDDYTVIRAETVDGFQFTPKFGPNDEPTIWDPSKHGGRIPRLEVAAAIDSLFRRYREPIRLPSFLSASSPKTSASIYPS